MRAAGLEGQVREKGQARRRPSQGRSKRRRDSRPRPAQPATDAPGPAWQEAARSFAYECHEALHADTGVARSAQSWLRGRGFTLETIRAAGLGLNTAERRPLRSVWGLTPKEKKKDGGALWLPRGIVIPWFTGSKADLGALWKVNIRRPNGDLKEGHDWKGRKYQLIASSANALYGAGHLRADRPAVIVEGELDALAIRQAAGDLAEERPSGGPLVTAVATGSTHGARRVRWIGRLAACPLVLVSFDADEAGEKAARYWLDLLPQARRWRPYWSDPADMLQSGGAELVRAWVAAGLEEGSPGGSGEASEDQGEVSIEAAPTAARPFFGFQNAETRRHVLWLCAPSGAGAEALPGRMTTAPFTLRPGCRVTDPVRCVRQLRADAVAGPEGPRALTGALQDDLRRLYQRFAQRVATDRDGSRRQKRPPKKGTPKRQQDSESGKKAGQPMQLLNSK